MEPAAECSSTWVRSSSSIPRRSPRSTTRARASRTWPWWSRRTRRWRGYSRFAACTRCCRSSTIGGKHSERSRKSGLDTTRARSPRLLAALSGSLGLEDEELDGEVGGLAVGAHERRDLTSGQPLDQLDEPLLHAVLPDLPSPADLVPLAILEQRLLAARVTASQDDRHQFGLQVGPAPDGALPVVVLIEADDLPRDVGPQRTGGLLRRHLRVRGVLGLGIVVRHAQLLFSQQPSGAAKRRHVRADHRCQGGRAAASSTDGRSWTRTRDLLLIREAL